MVKQNDDSSLSGSLGNLGDSDLRTPASEVARRFGHTSRFRFWRRHRFETRHSLQLRLLYRTINCTIRVCGLKTHTWHYILSIAIYIEVGCPGECRRSTGVRSALRNLGPFSPCVVDFIDCVIRYRARLPRPHPDRACPVWNESLPKTYIVKFSRATPLYNLRNARGADTQAPTASWRRPFDPVFRVRVVELGVAVGTT